MEDVDKQIIRRIRNLVTVETKGATKRSQIGDVCEPGTYPGTKGEVRGKPCNRGDVGDVTTGQLQWVKSEILQWDMGWWIF